MLVLKFNGISYPLRYQDDTGGRRTLVMSDPETAKTVAYLSWLKGEPHTIMEVRVGKTKAEAKRLRRKGIATALYRLAKRREPGIRHSRVRTNEGEAWASSLGEELPKRAYTGLEGH